MSHHNRSNENACKFQEREIVLVDRKAFWDPLHKLPKKVHARVERFLGRATYKVRSLDGKPGFASADWMV